MSWDGSDSADIRLNTCGERYIYALTGLGGVGKTQLAIEYAHKLSTYYDVVWWIRAEDPQTLQNDLANLAPLLGLPTEQDDQARKINAINSWLSHSSKWLLIFDNATGPEKLLSYIPSSKNGNVLITSRARFWKNLEAIPKVQVKLRDVRATK